MGRVSHSETRTASGNRTFHHFKGSHHRRQLPIGCEKAHVACSSLHPKAEFHLEDGERGAGQNSGSSPFLSPLGLRGLESEISVKESRPDPARVTRTIHHHHAHHMTLSWVVCKVHHLL